jgi:putative membrane-bound dehydrogenase-like protein
MKPRAWLLVALLAVALGGCRERSDTLRVFFHVAPSQSTNVPDASRLLAAWKPLLQQRGIAVGASSAFPTGKQLERAHVLVLAGAGALPEGGAGRATLEAFLRRGGGLLVLHEAAVVSDAEWATSLLGGAVPGGATNWMTARLPLQFACPPPALAEGMTGFDLEDGFARRVQLGAGAEVIARTLPTAAEAVPQIWAFEKELSRVFVALPGPLSPQLTRPPYRGLMLRGLAWLARRELDRFTTPDERTSWAYPEGGPASPARAAARIQTPPDFDLSLVAAEPLVVKPVALDWDARGRLWVAVMPESAAGGVTDLPLPALLFLSDTNGDGRMDTRTVFYQALRPITAFAFYRQGVIVAQPPEILFLRDADGDGALDHRETLFTGFGARDPRSSLSSFRWGLDGWLYAALGVSGVEATPIRGQGERAFGPIGPGLLRFKPDGSALEQVVAITNNTGGFDFSWDGEIFFAQAPGAHLSQVLVPERVLGTNRVGNATAAKALADHQRVASLVNDAWPFQPSVSATSAEFRQPAGAMVYEGGAWPMRYHGAYFVCEPAARVVHEDVFCTLENFGLEATRRDEQEFLASTDPWFCPVQLRFGPDGAAYLLDFYSRFGFWDNSRRTGPARLDCEAQLGRVWRLQHQAARRLQAPALDRATPLELLQALEHPNAWVRLTAQRLLVESGDASVAPPLAALLTNRVPHVRLHALWCLQHLGALTERNLAVVLTNYPHPLVQRATFRVLEEFAGPFTTNLYQTMVGQFKDADDRAKLLGLLAFKNFAADTNVVQTALRMFPDLRDAAARSAILALARRAPMDYIRAAFASAKSEGCRELVAPLVETFARAGQSSELTQVLQIAALHPNSTEKLNTAVLQTLHRFLETEEGLVWSGELETALSRLLVSKSRTARIAALPLATHWTNSARLRDQARAVQDALLAEARNPALKDEERSVLVTNLFAVPSLHADLVGILDDLLDRSTSLPAQRQLITDLGRLNERFAGEVLVKHYPRLTNELRPLLFSALLKRSEWALALVQAVERGELTTRDLDLLGINRLRNYPDPAVAARAIAAFDASAGAGALKQDRHAVLANFLPVAQGLAAPPPKELVDQGRPLYHRYCVNCHRFATHPATRDWVIDLTAAGTPGAASVLTNILHPNRAVDPRWLAWSATTTKGEHYFGALARATPDALVLRTFEGDVELKPSELAATNCTGVSFMPEGYELLGADALRAVLAYVMNKAPRGFRLLDLAGAFTADSRRALFHASARQPEIEFRRFGLVLVGSNQVPFHLVNPAGTPHGKNLVVLKGGAVQSVPARVEVPVQARASKLHVLGGVAGWGHPGGDAAQQSAPAAKLVFHFDNGQTEDVVLHNGNQFADYAQLAEVPGSTLATNLVNAGQLRWFTVEPTGRRPIAKLTLESFTNHLAPVFVALTVQE